MKLHAFTIYFLILTYLDASIYASDKTQLTNEQMHTLGICVLALSSQYSESSRILTSDLYTDAMIEAKKFATKAQIDDIKVKDVYGRVLKV